MLHYQNQVRYMGYLLSFGIPIEGDFVQKSNGFTGKHLYIRCRKPGDVIILKWSSKEIETFIYRFENPH